MRKCGLKHQYQDYKNINVFVTSLAEVWIETDTRSQPRQTHRVTSLAEVWIETPFRARRFRASASLPLRKCGLKLV